MYDEAELDDVERYLQEAPVLDVATFSTTTAHHSFRLILQGGLGAMAKPADRVAEGATVIRREAAAWIIARELGWSDLVAATIVRVVDLPASGIVGETSVQIIWPDNEPDADPSSFSDEDVWRAAIFDAVIGHSDRGGHNWLGVPATGAERRLKLVDHGYGFPDTRTAPSSTFYAMREGQPIPPSHLEAVQRLASVRHEAALSELLDGASRTALHDRANHLATSGTLTI
jgi:hypothetical protein